MFPDGVHAFEELQLAVGEAGGEGGRAPVDRGAGVLGLDPVGCHVREEVAAPTVGLPAVHAVALVLQLDCK